jgi:hypothetical protein
MERREEKMMGIPLTMLLNTVGMRLIVLQEKPLMRLEQEGKNYAL